MAFFACNRKMRRHSLFNRMVKAAVNGKYGVDKTEKMYYCIIQVIQ